VLNSYSATETGLIATALPPPAGRRRDSVGRPILDLRVLDANGADAGPGIPGEIWVRTPPMFSEYLDDAAANAAALRPDGWYRTGDLGYLDEDGFLFLTGRAGELINRGGDKIAPAEVDAALCAHPAVAAAGAFAIPDARWGEDVAAAVVLKDGQCLSAWELRVWALERLSPHKAPRQIWFVPELPRTALGKVQRSELRRMWLARLVPSGDREP
jgi:acyl-CoA synthetase (AMP-forming)/AMP-acid ligase II